MAEGILVLNAGSSSIKFSILNTQSTEKNLSLMYRGEIDGIGNRAHFFATDHTGKHLVGKRLHSKNNVKLSHEDALSVLLGWVDTHLAESKLIAAGHRVVHGGVHFSQPVKINPKVISQLDKLVSLAPLHQPHNIAAIRALANIRPNLLQVACFDTAFHRTQTPLTQAFPLPRELSEAGVKRYGFHGISYEYIAHVLPEFVGDAADGRAVVAHLGNGASMCAMKERKSIATTMGFTALDGLPMGTRCGSIDPGVVLYLMSELSMDVTDVTDILYNKSGLLGVSGISNDMRELLKSDSPHANEAIDFFVYRIGRELGSLVAALGGIDIFVFTAGIGEHAASIRERVCENAKWLGVRLDETANEKGGPRISKDDSAVSVWVIPTDEEKMIAQHTYSLIVE